MPNWYSLGALGDQRIDSVRVLYELGDLNEWNDAEISFSVSVYSFELEDVERWTSSELEQQYDTQMNLTIIGRDFLTYIEEYNIKFVAIDPHQVVSNIEATPALDKIYDNGKSNVFITKR